MNNEQLPKESIEIARYLVECAQASNPEPQTYSDVCRVMKSRHKRSHTPQELGSYLDPINKTSYSRASVLLSVLVVNKETRIPGSGFFVLAAYLHGDQSLLDSDSWKIFYNEEIKRVYESARNGKLNFFKDEK